MTTYDKIALYKDKAIIEIYPSDPEFREMLDYFVDHDGKKYGIECDHDNEIERYTKISFNAKDCDSVFRDFEKYKAEQYRKWGWSPPVPTEKVMSKLNRQCRDIIRNAIIRHQTYGTIRALKQYDMRSAVWSVALQCDWERAEWVLASNINTAVAANNGLEGLISAENREWAKNVGAPPARPDYSLNIPTQTLDKFVKQFRESKGKKPPFAIRLEQAQVAAAEHARSRADRGLKATQTKPSR